VNAELHEAGPESAAFGRGPVRAGGLAQEIAAIEVQGPLAHVDRLIGSLRGEAARLVRDEGVEFLDVDPDGYLVIDPISALDADDWGTVGVDGVKDTAQFIDGLVQPVAPVIFVNVRPYRHDQLVSQHAAVPVRGQELHERLGPLPAPVRDALAVDRELESPQHTHGQASARVTAGTRSWRRGQPPRCLMTRTDRRWCQFRRLDELVQQVQHALQPGQRPRLTLGQPLVLTVQVPQPTGQVLPLRQGPAARNHRAGQRFVTGLRCSGLKLAEHVLDRLGGEPVGCGTAVPPHVSVLAFVLFWSFTIPRRIKTACGFLGFSLSSMRSRTS
jgi:hypothetical protein